MQSLTNVSLYHAIYAYTLTFLMLLGTSAVSMDIEKIMYTHATGKFFMHHLATPSC